MMRTLIASASGAGIDGVAPFGKTNLSLAVEVLGLLATSGH